MFQTTAGSAFESSGREADVPGKGSASQPKQLSLHQRLKDFGKGASGFTNVRILVPISVVAIEESSHGAGMIFVLLSAAKNLCYSQIDPSLGS